MRKLLLALVIMVGVATPAAAVPARTAVSAEIAGRTVATDNAYQVRPALSLSKLYLGYWVLYHGTPEEKSQVEHMIRVSDDGLASRFDSKYPQAIDQIARECGLTATHRNGYWGNSGTSARDVAHFLAVIRPDPVAAPILNGMRTAAPHAADGYAQNFGTATLPGVEGTKFGWADDRASYHGTASIGQGFTIAALTHGNAAAHTADVHEFPLPAATPVPVPAPAPVPGLPELPGLSSLPTLPALQALPDVSQLKFPGSSL